MGHMIRPRAMPSKSGAVRTTMAADQTAKRYWAS